MPKKRRKLDRELEKEIATAKKKVELISAKINDIDEEDIQSEYRSAFQLVLVEYLSLSNLYTSSGVTPETSLIRQNYYKLLEQFENEYEI